MDLTAALVAFVGFFDGTIIGGRLSRHLDSNVRVWLTTALGLEVVALAVLAAVAGANLVHYHDYSKLILIVGLAVVSAARTQPPGSLASRCAPRFCRPYSPESLRPLFRAGGCASHSLASPDNHDQGNESRAEIAGTDGQWVRQQKVSPRSIEDFRSVVESDRIFQL